MAELINLDRIQPNPWNPNVMQKEEYEALKQDMHVHGVNGIDPLLVSPSNVFHGKDWEKQSVHFDIVDGEHRFKAAMELSWKEIRCEVQNITEEDAKSLCYRRNRERGTLDPFKEAALFKSDLEHSMTQAQVAGKYGIEQGTVSHRLSLLKLRPEIIEKVQSMPRGIITPSHLEPIATLELEDQKIIATALLRETRGEEAFWSARTIQDQVARIKKERADQKLLAKALETANYPKCPTCKKQVTRINYNGLPWVNASCYHNAWNLNTGRGEYSPQRRIEKDEDGKPKSVQSSVLRSAHTVKELRDLFIKHAKEIVPKVDIRNVKVSGKLDGSPFSLDLDDYGKTLHVSISQSSVSRYFSAEEHKYRTGEVTCIHTGSPSAVEDVREFIDNAFQGKLVIQSKRLKNTKGTLLDSEESLEAENIQTTEKTKESLAEE